MSPKRIKDTIGGVPRDSITFHRLQIIDADAIRAAMVVKLSWVSCRSRRTSFRSTGTHTHTRCYGVVVVYVYVFSCFFKSDFTAFYVAKCILFEELKGSN